jgi:YhcH/YjgK/YiaL family protein
MLISSIKNHKNILKFFPQLDIVFDFLLNKVSSKTIDGKYNITKDIYAVVANSEPKPKEEQLLEAHKKYIDLQYILVNTDNIGWKFLDKSFKISKRYNKKNDISFYKNKPDIFFKLKKGDFVIFFPEDAHAPLCNLKKVKKCIIKIPKEYLGG